MKQAVVIFLSGFLLACEPAAQPPADAGPSQSSAVVPEALSTDGKAGELVVRDARIQPPVAGRRVTAGYMTLISPVDDKLIGASANGVEAIELHAHDMVDGMMQMRQLESVDLPAQTPVAFKPMGLHLMIFGAAGLSDVSTLPVTLDFASGRTVTTEFPVRN